MPLTLVAGEAHITFSLMQEALTAEYAKYAENSLPADSPSAYSAYSAVFNVGAIARRLRTI
jgi:hypothetical protein